MSKRRRKHTDYKATTAPPAPRKRIKWPGPRMEPPPLTDMMPEELAQEMFKIKGPLPELTEVPKYSCIDCKRRVRYPETLYQDGRCEQCHEAAS